MTQRQEIFSFPIEILDGPRGERNFEMYRAEQRHKIQQERQVHQSLDCLIARASEPFEFNFEMIRMLSYIRKRVDPVLFNLWPSPLLSAQFMLHKIAQATENEGASARKSIETRTVGTQTVKHEPDPEEPKVRPRSHRGLPGYNTILQCGEKTIADDTALLSTSTVPVAYNTPTYGRINRLFGGEETNCSQGADSKDFELSPLLETDLSVPPSQHEDIPKENAVPMDLEVPAITELPSFHPNSNVRLNSAGKSVWNPWVESTKVTNPLCTISSNVTSFDTDQHKTTGPSAFSKTPFEFFHDSYLKYTNTKLVDHSGSLDPVDPCTDRSIMRSVQSKPPSQTKNPPTSSKTPIEFFHDSMVQPAASSKSSERRNVDPRLTKRASLGTPNITTTTAVPTVAAKPLTSSVPKTIPIESLDDTAIFDLLEEKLAAIPKSKVPENINSTELDSPTRFIQFLTKRCGPSKPR